MYGVGWVFDRLGQDQGDAREYRDLGTFEDPFRLL